MERFKLPPIAPKEEIQKFISNLNSFATEADFYQTPRDIVAPTSFAISLATPHSNCSDKPESSEPPIVLAKIDSVQSCISFFNQPQIPIGQEIPFSSIPKLIVQITSGPFGAKMCFAAYIRSLSLMIQFLLTKDSPPIDRINKNLSQKAVDIILSLPVKTQYAPDMNQHPFLDFGIINYRPSTPTAICSSTDSVFISSKDGSIMRYTKSKAISLTRGFYKTPSNFGFFSMVYNKENLYMISQSKNCIVYNLTTKKAILDVITPLTYPAISDGYNYYCVLFELTRVRVRIFDNSFERLRKSIKLSIPDSVELSADMPMSTNGTFINFIDQLSFKCHVFSVFTGKFLYTTNISSILYSVSYDASLYSFLCLTNNGLVEIPSRTSIPPWMLNFSVPKTVISGGYKESVLEALSVFAIHFVGGGFDIPLSMTDMSCIASLQALLSYLMKPSPKMSESVIIAMICILQVKIRKFGIGLEQIVESLIMFFSQEKLEFARKAASFLFLSNLSLFEKDWTKKHSFLLKLIVDDKNCTENVFAFLPLFSFDVPFLDESLISSIINLTLQPNKARKFKSVIILSTIQNRLVELLPKTEPLFTSYVTLLMIKMSEQWTTFLSSGSTQTSSSTCFIVVKKLELLIMKNIKRIELPLIVTERLFAVSIMQQMGSDEQNLLCQQIFNRLLYIALHFAFKAVETDKFVVCSEKVDSNHPNLKYEDFKKKLKEAVNDNNSNEEELLLLFKCANEANWNNESEIFKFVVDVNKKLKINNEMLENRIREIEKIQPQPLRKIAKYIITGEFGVTKYTDSAIYQLMNYAQWIPNSFSKLIFALFLDKIKEFQDDFLCIPPNQLLPFVQRCPITLLFPLSIIKFSKLQIKESTIELYDLALSFDTILNIISVEQSEEFIKPLLTLTLKTKISSSTNENNKLKMHRALLSALIAFKKSDIELTNQILTKLVECSRAVTSLKTVKILLEIVKVYALKANLQIFDFIVEIIGGCMMKRSNIFPKAKSVRVMFQFAFEFVEFARDLLTNSKEFRSFLIFGIQNLDEVYTNAFFTIVNNLVTYPMAGCVLCAINSNNNHISSTIAKVSKNGHKIQLENSEVYDIRNLKDYNVTSHHQIDGNVFEDIDGIVDMFNKYEVNSPICMILYISSLHCLSFNKNFISKFENIERFVTNVEPINDQYVYRKFWEFYTHPSKQEALEIFSFGKEKFATSPISPSFPFAANFSFPVLCEATLYCFFQCSPHALEYQTVSFAESFNFVLDPDSLQISMTASDKTVTFPVLNSAIFYSVCVKAKSVNFKVKKCQQSLDKLNSFDCFDFSAFSPCLINTPIVTICDNFQDSFLSTLGGDIRNKCLKKIIPNILKVKPIDPTLCMSYFHTLFSDFDEIFKSGPKMTKKPSEKIDNFDSIMENVNSHQIVGKFISSFQSIINNEHHQRLIWRNNSYARPVKKGAIVEDCVVICKDGGILLVKEKKEVDQDCYILPINHLNRTAIETLLLAKNCLVFCKIVGDEQSANEMKTIMKNCEKNGIPGFAASTDLKSVDMIIQEVEELFGH